MRLLPGVQTPATEVEKRAWGCPCGRAMRGIWTQREDSPALCPGSGALADELLEAGLVADRVEVRVIGGELPKPRPRLDRLAEVLDRLCTPAREALAAGEVVERPDVLWVCLDQLAALVGRGGIVTRLVERADLSPDLPADRLVRLPKRRAHGNNGRPRLIGERRPGDSGTDEDERAGGGVNRLAVELEPRAPFLHEVELLLLLALVVLVVLVDDPVARLGGRPGVDAEGLDAEVVPHGPPWAAAVRDLVDVIEVRRREPGHLWRLAARGGLTSFRPRRTIAVRVSTS